MWNLTIICEKAVVLNACFDDSEMLKLVIAMYKMKYNGTIYTNVQEESNGNYIIVKFMSLTEMLRKD